MTTAVSSNVFYTQVQTFTSSSYQSAPNKCTSSIQTLIAQLNISPFIVGAKLGPQVYTDAPFELENKIDGVSVYGWKPGSNRKETTAKFFFVLGADDDKKLVYYACAQRDCLNPSNYRRDPTDQKIYAVSLKRFQASVTCFVLPTVPKPSLLTQQVELTPDEKVWFDKFLEFPIETILGEREAECKALAQKAFDAFKQKFSGNSILAKEALVHICDAMRNSPKTSQYHGHLERAWDGVGDEIDVWLG